MIQAVNEVIRRDCFKQLRLNMLRSVPPTIFSGARDFNAMAAYCPEIFDDLTSVKTLKHIELDAYTVMGNWRQASLDMIATKIPVGSLKISHPNIQLSLERLRKHPWQELDFLSTWVDLSDLRQLEFRDSDLDDEKSGVHDQLNQFLARFGRKITKFTFQPSKRYTCNLKGHSEPDPVSLYHLSRLRHLEIDFYSAPLYMSKNSYMPAHVVPMAFRWLRELLLHSPGHLAQLRTVTVHVRVENSGHVIRHARILDDYLSERAILPGLSCVKVILYMPVMPQWNELFKKLARNRVLDLRWVQTQ
jgi:hypothetical protein